MPLPPSFKRLPASKVSSILSSMPRTARYGRRRISTDSGTCAAGRCGRQASLGQHLRATSRNTTIPKSQTRSEGCGLCCRLGWWFGGRNSSLHIGKRCASVRPNTYSAISQPEGTKLSCIELVLNLNVGLQAWKVRFLLVRARSLVSAVDNGAGAGSFRKRLRATMFTNTLEPRSRQLLWLDSCSAVVSRDDVPCAIQVDREPVIFQVCSPWPRLGKVR